MFELCLILVYLLFVHYIADFVMQPRDVANNKSKSILYLLLHTLQYMSVTIVLAPLPAWMLIGIDEMLFKWYSSGAIYYTFVIGATHFLIDLFTSKFNKWSYCHGQEKLFWSGIGGDQFLHETTIICTTFWIWSFIQCNT